MDSLAIVLILCIAAALSAPASSTTTFHVAPNGSDRHPGTASRPFATLERARDAVRDLKRGAGLPAGGVIVEARAGDYELDRPLELTAEDSGAPGTPIVWQSRLKSIAAKGDTTASGDSISPDGAARLIGGRFVSGWRKVTDRRILDRLDPSARARVRQANLRSLGITRFGEMKSAPGWGSSEPGLELFFRGRPMTLARWPNEGYAAIKEVLDTNFDVRGTKGSTQPGFYYEGDRPSRWVDEPDLMLHGWWFWDWADQRYRVRSIDTAKGILSLDAPRGEFRKGQWYYAYNALSELDRPGEWILDRVSGVLYFWPPETPRRNDVMVSLLPGLVTMRGASHVAFRGFVLEGCQGTAITIEDGEASRIEGCVVRNTGGFAVRVEGGRNHRVAGCDLYQMGDGGIVLHGGEFATLAHAGHVAENNWIHHYSRWNPMYKCGIEMVGVGCRASHNLIHHAPHVAIGFNGPEHTIEYNEIHNVVEGANDAGAIYTQPGIDETWTMRGNVVRYNYLHHIYGFQGKGCVGVYLDDCFSSVHGYGNIFHRVPSAAFIGGGRDSLFENNLFIDCSPAVHVDARGLGWASGIESFLRRNLAETPYRQPPWSARYPQLLTLLDREPMAPVGNVFARNVCWGGRWDDIEERARSYVRFEKNLVGVDPRFEDAGRLDFRLRPDSPAWEIGFRRIPVEKIGLYRDEHRASWPVKHPFTPPSDRQP